MYAEPGLAGDTGVAGVAGVIGVAAVEAVGVPKLVLVVTVDTQSSLLRSPQQQLFEDEVVYGGSGCWCCCCKEGSRVGIGVKIDVGGTSAYVRSNPPPMAAKVLQR